MARASIALCPGLNSVFMTGASMDMLLRELEVREGQGNDDSNEPDEFTKPSESEDRPDAPKPVGLEIQQAPVEPPITPRPGGFGSSQGLAEAKEGVSKGQGKPGFKERSPTALLVRVHVRLKIFWTNRVPLP